MLDTLRFTGRAAEQVTEILADRVEPVLRMFPQDEGPSPELRV